MIIGIYEEFYVSI